MGEDDRYRVQSLGRALDIVELIAAAGRHGSRLTDLAQAVGISKAAAYAIIQTLIARRVLSATGEGMTKRYHLGLSLVRLGDMAVTSTGIADVAMPILRQLTQSIAMTSRIAVWDEDAAVVVARADAPDSVRFDEALGRRERAYCSAVGKVFLAAMPRADALAVLARTGHPERTPRTLHTIAALEADLDATRTRHYGIDDEEDHEGISCVAAGVFGYDGTAIAAISVTTLKQLLPDDAVPALAGAIIEHANRVSAALGGVSAAQAWSLRVGPHFNAR